MHLVHCDSCNNRCVSKYCDSVWFSQQSDTTKSHCDICGISFNAIQEHGIKCHSCNWSLRNISTLVRHALKDHHNRKGFVCSECPSQFSDQSKYENHIEYHVHSYFEDIFLYTDYDQMDQTRIKHVADNLEILWQENA